MCSCPVARRNASVEVSPAMRAPPSVAATSPVAASAPPPSSAVATRPASVFHPKRPSCIHAQVPATASTVAPTTKNPGCVIAPPASRRAAAIVPRRVRRASAAAAAMNAAAKHEVRHVAAAQERRPGAGQHAGGKPSTPRQGAPASPGEGNGGQPDRRAERVLQATEPRDETLIQRAGHRGDQGGRAGALARQREPARHRHPRPPQVDGHVGADGERIHVAQGRPQEQAEQHGAQQPDQREVDGRSHVTGAGARVGRGGVHSGGDRITDRCYHRRHAGARSRRRGARGRPPARWRLRGGLRRGALLDLGPARRRSGRGAHDGPRSRRRRPGLPRHHVRLRVLEPAGSRLAPGGRGRRQRRASRATPRARSSI